MLLVYTLILIQMDQEILMYKALIIGVRDIAIALDNIIKKKRKPKHNN